MLLFQSEKYARKEYRYKQRTNTFRNRRRERSRRKERYFRLTFRIRADSLDFKLTRESSVLYACVSCVSSMFSLSNPSQPPDSPTKMKSRKKCVTRCLNDKRSGHAPFVHLQTRIAYRQKKKKKKGKAYGQGHRSIYLKQENHLSKKEKTAKK